MTVEQQCLPKEKVMAQIRGLIFLLPGIVLLVGSAASSQQPAPPAAGEGRLTVTEEPTPGLSYCTVEFVRGDTLVRTKVAYGYNPPSGDSVHQGDLLPVYLVITSQAPKKPVHIVTAGELIKLIEAQGYEVSAVKGRRDDGKAAKKGDPPGPRVQVYTVRPGLMRPAEPPSVPAVPK
jgi:hypothetical protein